MGGLDFGPDRPTNLEWVFLISSHSFSRRGVVFLSILRQHLYNSSQGASGVGPGAPKSSEINLDKRGQFDLNKVSQNLLAASRPLSGIFICTIRNESERAMCLVWETTRKSLTGLESTTARFCCLRRKGGRDGIYNGVVFLGDLFLYWSWRLRISSW